MEGSPKEGDQSRGSGRRDGACNACTSLINEELICLRGIGIAARMEREPASVRVKQCGAEVEAETSTNE
eukprot:366130-Chlamydomonas_euryale.AAC.5